MKVKILSIVDSKTFKAESTLYKAHEKYGKYITTNKKYLVHYEDTSKLKIGDDVVISQSKPISKRKKWVLKG
jgi:ribosomal protein S17